MKALVIYRSKTGFSERYAQSIARELNARLINMKEVTVELLRDYDLIIYGAGIYAGIIAGYKKIRKMLAKANKEKLVLFAVGAAPKEAYATIERMWRLNIKESELKTLPHFYLQGGIAYERLGVFKRSVLKRFMSVAYKKDSKHDLTKSFDNVTAGALIPLLRYLNINK